MKHSEKPGTARGGANTDTSFVIFGTIADTMWRMFVPVFGMTGVGYLLDRVFATRPILVISGMVVGIIIAVLLVVQQYRQTMKGPKA